MSLRSSLRTLLGAWFGDWTSNRTGSIGAPPQVPAELAAVSGIAAQAIADLCDFQSPSYARLYLARVGRFAARSDVDADLLIEIASALAGVMMYRDAIREAQCVLRGGPERTMSLTLDEAAALLPRTLAENVRDGLDTVGWRHVGVSRKFSRTPFPRRWLLTAEARLRPWRPVTLRDRQERALAERWLHMIARALARQPDAAMAMAWSAGLLVEGVRDRTRLARWHAIVNTIAKPSFDGEGREDLADAMTAACAAAMTQDDATFAQTLRDLGRPPFTSPVDSVSASAGAVGGSPP